MQFFNVIFGALGGLALFLFGLQILSGGFKKIAGGRLQKLLKKLTSSPWRGVALGATITAIIQSSSITMVTLIGLINAGLLNLKQAIGVMLGAEIGTTFTAQIVAFKIGIYYLPLIALGFGFYFFARSQKIKYVGQIILGFGLLFLGMQLMKQGLSPLKEEAFFTAMLKDFGVTPFKGIIAGALLTALIQSSSATIGLIIALAAERLILLPSAIALLMGANIGTCITALLSSIKATLPAKRTSFAQLITNILGVSILALLIHPFTQIVAKTSTNLPRQIANAHTLFNIAVTLGMMPFIGVLVKLTEKIVPGRIEKIERGTRFLDEKILNSSSLALAQAKKETARMGKIAQKMLNQANKSLINGKKNLIKLVRKKEEIVDNLNISINDYLTKISSLDLSKRDSRRLTILINAITDIERVGDHANNLTELAELKTKKKISFSSYAQEELMLMSQQATESYAKALLSLIKNDKK